MMRLNLATKFSATIVSVVALAILSSAVALVSTWQIRRLMRDTVRKDLPSVRAAGELQMALCEPRGFLASYILDGSNRKWLKQLQEEKHMFHDRLAEARATVHSPEEKDGLDRLEKAYREYEARRDQVVLLSDHGDVEEAKRVLLVDVNDLYQKAFEQVEDFVASTQRNADTRMFSSRLFARGGKTSRAWPITSWRGSPGKWTLTSPCWRKTPRSCWRTTPGRGMSVSWSTASAAR